jgi:plastocyanin
VNRFFAAAVIVVLAHVAAPSRVLVEAREYHFTLSRTTVKPGPAIVQLAIRGEDPHDLAVRRIGAASVSRVPETLPGAVAEWRGTLKKGRYELYCTIEGHKKLGMRTVLTVK